MTPCSFQAVPVPDRYISRLRHSQSRTRRERESQRVNLRAIQISCTPFHPLHRLSLALFILDVCFIFLLHMHFSFLSLPLQVPTSFFYPLLSLFNFPLPPQFSLSSPLFPLHVFFSPLPFPMFSLPTQREIGIFFHKWRWRCVCLLWACT